MARPKEQLPSLPLAKLYNVRVNGREQLVEEKFHGAFHLASKNQNEKPCKKFLEKSAVHDRAMLRGLNHTMPFWNVALAMMNKIAMGKNRPHYVVDLESSLFPPDCSNAW